MVVEDGPSFACFGSVGEESVDSGGGYLREAFREQGVFKPFSGTGLSGSFLIGGTFDDGVPGVLGDLFAGDIEIIGERWVDPPRVVLAWLVFWDGEVCHGAFFVSCFLKVGPFGSPGAHDFGGSYHGRL